MNENNNENLVVPHGCMDKNPDTRIQNEKFRYEYTELYRSSNARYINIQYQNFRYIYISHRMKILKRLVLYHISTLMGIK
jgi:hypothetical protein